MADRCILHVDMDAFFASVEQLDEPSLRGRPVLVGGSGRRGVVAAASYEARVFGCRSAMPTAVARRLCPDAVIVKPRGSRYRELSKIVFGIAESFTPLVQPLSIDEAFLDVTGSRRLFGDGIEIARSLRLRIADATGLTASVGVAPNKFLAKLASDLDKPDGLTVIDAERVSEVLDPLPISRIWGVGEAAERRLAGLGVRTIGDARRIGEPALRARFGEFGAHVARLSRGEDARPVVTDRVAKSISHERTFHEDVGDADQIRGVIVHQSEDVARRLRACERRARRVSVKVRFGDFETITRAETLAEPTDETSRIARGALALFDHWVATAWRPVRLIGVQVAQLDSAGAVGAAQPGLFDQGDRERARRLDAVADAVAEKLGPGAIRRASSVRVGRADGIGHERRAGEDR